MLPNLIRVSGIVGLLFFFFILSSICGGYRKKWLGWTTIIACFIVGAIIRSAMGIAIDEPPSFSFGMFIWIVIPLIILGVVYDKDGINSDGKPNRPHEAWTKHEWDFSLPILIGNTLAIAIYFFGAVFFSPEYRHLLWYHVTYWSGLTVFVIWLLSLPIATIILASKDN